VNFLREGMATRTATLSIRGSEVGGGAGGVGAVNWFVAERSGLKEYAPRHQACAIATWGLIIISVCRELSRETSDVEVSSAHAARGCQLHTVLPGGLRSSRGSSSSQTSHNLGLGCLGALRLGLVVDARTGSETRGAFELRYKKKEKQTTKAQMRAMEV